MDKILTRTLTGIVYIALIVAATIGGVWPFAIIFSLILILGILELEKLCKHDTPIPLFIPIMDIAGGLLLFLSLFFSYVRPEWNINPISCYLPYLIIRLVSQLYIKEGNSLRMLADSAMTQLIVALPLSLLNILHFEPEQSTLLLSIFIFIWVNDTGAYCIGSMFGKHRLFERISPKKSWEGFFGGLAFTIIAGILIAVFNSGFFPHFSTAVWIGLSIVVSIFATWGDLVESLLKRTANVKDSGNILPGHGGVLDRIDSLLLVIPAVLLYISLL